MFQKLAMAIGVSFVVAACGGGEPAQQPAQSPEAAPAAPAAGATYDVNMVLEGTATLFVPSELTIKAGDKINFHNVSGGPHNAQFWADSIPAGASDALSAGMPDQMAPLAGPLVVEPDGIYSITFASVPAGEYKFYCLPHLATGMTGRITVTP